MTRTRPLLRVVLFFAALAAPSLLTPALLTPALATPALATGIAVDGRDRARILPPPGAEIEGYENAGYQLRRGDGEVDVTVDTTPLGSTSPFRPPTSKASPPKDPIQRLARARTVGATTQYEAASRILSWISRHIEYRLNRRESQDAASVLEQRRGYCTGIARLTVALLGAVGIEAREVAGYVVDDGSGHQGRGYHRWVEIRFPDVGWVFSDPLTHHHYVPATYIRLASGQLETHQGLEGLLLERVDAVEPVDIHPFGASGVLARRNSPRRRAAALRVRVEDAPTGGQAVLEGAVKVYHQRLRGERVTFVGLSPGLYRLRLDLPGQEILRHEIELADRRAEDLQVRGFAKR